MNQQADTGYRLVLEIEVPEFYVDGTEQEFADEHDLTVFDIATEEWMRRDVGLTFVSIPGEKNLSSDFEVHAMNGRIVGARIVSDGDS
jgi:hypothetical protein